MLLSLARALQGSSAPAQAVDGSVFVPVVGVVSMFPLVAFVVVPVSCGLLALGTGVRLFSRVPQHVPLQVHALVARVAAPRPEFIFGAQVQ